MCCRFGLSCYVLICIRIVAHRTTNINVEKTCKDTHSFDSLDTGTIEPNPTVLCVTSEK